MNDEVIQLINEMDSHGAKAPRNDESFYKKNKNGYNGDKEHHYKSKAFTLAEVLITLGIIGIVAALIIPNFIAKYQKQKTVGQLKKAYSTLSQAIELSKVDNLEPSMWDYALSANEYNQKYFIPYLKIIKIGQNDHKFWARNNSEWKPEYYFADDLFFQAPILYLSDGMILKILLTSSTIYNENLIIVDINGKVKPNMLGRDVFVFLIPKVYRTSGFGYDVLNGDIKNPNGVWKLVPYGYGWDRETLKRYCSPGSNSRKAGATCAALIINDGWQIKEDYPW